jgi:hypothetical protein
MIFERTRDENDAVVSVRATPETAGRTSARQTRGDRARPRPRQRRRLRTRGIRVRARRSPRLVVRAARSKPPSTRRLARAANGQQTSEIALAQPCASESREARRPAWIERFRVNRRQPSRPFKRPVTPEVAGSSPVAPVENTLQLGRFCCRFWRHRPPVFHRSRAHPARESETRFGHGKRCKSACSLARPGGQSLRSSRAHPASR